MNLIGLYFLFLRYGLLCFGGGYMLVPFITADLVGEGKILSPLEFANLVSIAQVTPGPVGLNTATYTGFSSSGVFGAVLASLGLATPALLLVILASQLLKKYRESHPVQGFLGGMKPASFGMVCAALVIFGRLAWFRSVPDFFAAAPLISGAAFFLLKKWKVPMIPLLLGCAALGALFLH